MLLYNTQTARKETFVIPTDRPLKLYVCGVTPYETTHMGHARTYLVFDVLLRFLRWQGATVHYCQNVTDVDDPLFERAERDGVAWHELAAEQVARYQADCAALNIIAPTFFPWASDEIPAMQEMIARLVDQGHAYVQAGNVYFAVASDPGFGSLARLDYPEMLELANQRGNHPDDPHKRDPLDFVLWQRGKPGDPTWDSAWGPGRPGWHIECSAMARRYLGDQIDIHGGGKDLIFPHHACEIAQSEHATGQHPFVRAWVHSGLVWLDGAKMSKSLGNLVYVRDALNTYDADTLRWYLLTFPYADDFNYEDAGVQASAAQVAQMRSALTARSGTGAALDLTDQAAAFQAALADNLDTPRALHVLAQAADTVHAAAAEGRTLAAAQETLRTLTAAIGLRLG